MSMQQQPNASPLKVPLGLPIPASPADSGFLPRREFLPTSSKRPLSTFSLLTFTGTGSLRLSAFPQPVVHALHRFFEERKLLRMFRDNRSPIKDKNDIERDRGPEDRGFERKEEEDLAEFTLIAKFWANAKSLDTEKLMVQILILLNSLGYALLSSIDFAREPGDKLTLVFERHILPGTTQAPQFGHHANGSTTSHPQQPPHSASLPPPSSGNGIQQQIFGLSFTSQTSFRCICPPLESTPGILMALRNAWPKGVEEENKIADGCYEFKLKGYAFFAEDTFQIDSLALIFSILKSFQRLQFSLVASLSLSNSHARSKDLWLFSTTETDALTPHRLLNSISSSPASYTMGTVNSLPGSNFPSRQQSADPLGEKKPGHGRSASADTTQSSISFAPGHQRHATTPTFGSAFAPGNQGNTISPSGTITSRTGGKQGSVLVKKSVRASPKPTNSAGLPISEVNVTPPAAAGRTTTPPKSSNTPPGATSRPSPGGELPPIAPKPTAKVQQQQVLYSTPTTGNILYSTPSAAPPAYGSTSGHHPNVSVTGPSPPASPPPGGKNRHSSQANRPNNIDLPSNSFSRDEDEEEGGPTPPLLSSAAFRDTLLDHDRDATTSVLSVRSGESFDVPVMWTGTGGLGAVGLGPTLEEQEEEEEETFSREVVTSSVPAVPGGWVDDAQTSKDATRRPTKDGRPSKEKERTFDAKVDGAQIVNIASEQPELSPRGTTILGSDDLQRRKSQEAVVHTFPGTGGAGDQKKDGWVMVNVSGDQSRNKVTKPPTATRRVPSTSNSPPPETATPPAVVAPPAPSYLNDALASGSGEESSSSHDRKDKDASALKPGITTTTTSTTPPAGKKSGFRRLFGRDKKDKSERDDKDKGSEKSQSTPPIPSVPLEQ